MKRAGALLVGLLFIVSSALGHSDLQRSEPKSGAMLPRSPNEIKLRFSEPIKVGLSTIAVRNEAGKQVDRNDLHSDEKDPALVRLSLAPDLPPGLYKVSWSAVAQDLHVSKGDFSFRVASAAK